MSFALHVQVSKCAILINLASLLALLMLQTQMFCRSTTASILDDYLVMSFTVSEQGDERRLVMQTACASL